MTEPERLALGFDDSPFYPDQTPGFEPDPVYSDHQPPETFQGLLVGQVRNKYMLRGITSRKCPKPVDAVQPRRTEFMVVRTGDGEIVVRPRPHEILDPCGSPLHHGDFPQESLSGQTARRVLAGTEQEPPAVVKDAHRIATKAYRGS